MGFDERLVRDVDDPEARHECRNLIHEHGIGHLPVRNLRHMVYVPKAQGLGQKEDEKGHADMQHHADIEYPVAVPVRLPLLDIDVTACGRAHRGSEEPQHRYDAGHDVVKAVVRSPQVLHQKPCGEDPDEHDDDHPDVEYQGVLRDACIFLPESFHLAFLLKNLSRPPLSAPHKSKGVPSLCGPCHDAKAPSFLPLLRANA